MTTTQHPINRTIRTVLTEAADLLEGEGWQPVAAASGRRRYGIPEAVAECAPDATSRIVAERALSLAGYDIWWNDLQCQNGDEAADALRRTAHGFEGIEQLYGVRADAVVGVFRVADTSDAHRISALGFQVSGREWACFEAAAAAAVAVGGAYARYFLAATQDVAMCAYKHDLKTPAAVERHLRGVRALELAAGYYTLPLEVAGKWSDVMLGAMLRGLESAR